MLVEILHSDVAFVERRLATPLVLSTGVIEAVTEARATVTVRVAGREATGRGAVYLSDLWAWPDVNRSHADRDRALRNVCQELAANLPTYCGPTSAHPLELGLRLHAAVSDWRPNSETARHNEHRQRFRERCDPTMPELARILCASTFDAALHDAAGIALERSAFRFYDDPVAIPAADEFFPSVGACRAIRRILRTSPRRVFPATVVVGSSDRLDELFERWVVERRYRRAKVKLSGRSTDDDAAIVARVVDAFAIRGVREPYLTLDANEAYRDAAHVAQLLEALDRFPYARRAVQYVEQPTTRDATRPLGDWSQVAARLPMLVDEALTSPATLATAMQRGWSGAALKTCKGHSFCLVAAAWLHARGLQVALHDLTNPGHAALHAAWFGAFVPTVNGLELNSPQFTPDANAEWMPEFAALLEPSDGVHRLPAHIPWGLGGCERHPATPRSVAATH